MLNTVQVFPSLSVQDMTTSVHGAAATSSARTEFRSVSDWNKMNRGKKGSNKITVNKIVQFIQLKKCVKIGNDK